MPSEAKESSSIEESDWSPPNLERFNLSHRFGLSVLPAVPQLFEDIVQPPYLEKALSE